MIYYQNVIWVQVQICILNSLQKSPIFLRYKVVSKGLGDDFQFFGLLRMFELYQTALLNKVGQISVLNAYSFFFQFQDIQ